MSNASQAMGTRKNSLSLVLAIMALAVIVPVADLSGAVAQGRPPSPKAPAYSAQSILDHFLAPKPEGTRAVCIGTCAKQPEPAGFDLEVTFGHNSDALTEEARRNLDQFAMALNDPRLSELRFSVDGHTDASGPETYNMTLSERRARSVVSYLAEQGIAKGRLQPRGFGKTQPKAPDPFDGANRRVETKLLQ